MRAAWASETHHVEKEPSPTIEGRGRSLEVNFGRVLVEIGGGGLAGLAPQAFFVCVILP